MFKKTGIRVCATKYCRGRVTDDHLKCSKCRKREHKTRNPKKYTFSSVKNNARRRGKNFTLTMDDFMELVTASGYMHQKGRKGHNLSIDRIDSRRGYEPGNVRVITVRENSIKQDKDCPF